MADEAIDPGAGDPSTGGSSTAVEAKVLELLPQGAVKLELASRAQVIGHPAGAAKVNFVRLRPNDRVLVELSPHDKSRGRIVKLLA